MDRGQLSFLGVGRLWGMLPDSPCLKHRYSRLRGYLRWGTRDTRPPLSTRDRTDRRRANEDEHNRGHDTAANSSPLEEPISSAKGGLLLSPPTGKRADVAGASCAALHRGDGTISDGRWSAGPHRSNRDSPPLSALLRSSAPRRR